MLFIYIIILLVTIPCKAPVLATLISYPNVINVLLFTPVSSSAACDQTNCSSPKAHPLCYDYSDLLTLSCAAPHWTEWLIASMWPGAGVGATYWHLLTAWPLRWATTHPVKKLRHRCHRGVTIESVMWSSDWPLSAPCKNKSRFSREYWGCLSLITHEPNNVNFSLPS